MTGALITMTGFFHAGFELAELYPIGWNEPWWLDGGPAAGAFWERYRGILEEALPAGRGFDPAKGCQIDPWNDRDVFLFVKLKGRIYEEKCCGHLGGWKYRFELLEVIEARLPTETDPRITIRTGPDPEFLRWLASPEGQWVIAEALAQGAHDPAPEIGPDIQIK